MARLGVGWRPGLALLIERRPGLGFIELIAEDFADAPLPPAVDNLRRRGAEAIPHGISLSLGGAALPKAWRVKKLDALARKCGASLVSEHLCFVRGGGIESGHLLPVRRTGEMLEAIVENIRHCKRFLHVPLAVENISSPFDWPDEEMTEPAFLRAVLEKADVRLLLDVANVHANAVNLGRDPVRFLEELPLERVAYCHIAGGIVREGHYHDTHTRRTSPEALALLEELAARIDPPGVLLERDDDFPSEDEFNAELDDIEAALARGARRREAVRGS